MNKLNRKGFTLIELLAVIVILAIVLVVSVPQILGSVSSARQSQFENAVTTIETYANNQYGLCILNDEELRGSDFNSEIFKTVNSKIDCTQLETTKLITAAGYSTDDIASVDISFANGKYSISGATAGNGKFKDATYSK